MRPGEPGHRRCGACRSCHRGSLLGTESPTAVTPQWEPWNLSTRRAGPLVQRSVWVRPRWQDIPVSATHPFTAPFLSFQVGHRWTNGPVGARQDHPVRMHSPGLSEVGRSRVWAGGSVPAVPFEEGLPWAWVLVRTGPLAQSCVALCGCFIHLRSPAGGA